jgi:hypothetical protein
VNLRVPKPRLHAHLLDLTGALEVPNMFKGQTSTSSCDGVNGERTSHTIKVKVINIRALCIYHMARLNAGKMK